jgi:signal transduction histidine kinase
VPHFEKEHIYTVGGLLAVLIVFGWFLRLVSPGPMVKISWLTVFFEGLFFLFVFFWNVAILPYWQTSKTLCAGSLFLLIGSFADAFDNFFIEPRWENSGIENLLLTLGAALFGLGIWFWAEEKDRLLEQLQKDRDLEKAVVPKLSHDIRIPLRNMSDAVRRLEQDSSIQPDANWRAALDAIQRGIKDVNLQMENIVEAHWLKSGSSKLRPTIFGITQLFDETSDEFRYQAEDKSITIVKRCTAGEISLKADRLKVRRIIQNLLDNAIKFCAANGKVTVEATATPAEITVRVCDEGRGIPEEQMLKINQGSATTFGRGNDEDQESAGLGLSIVREFVQLHGGRFWVESNSPNGARFCFALPLDVERKA